MSYSIVICASFRFYNDVVELQRKLDEAGFRCEIPVPNEYLDPKRPWKFQEDLVVPEPKMFQTLWKSIEDHLKRIEDTDIVYVHGGGEGYVGRGVASEMGYSQGLQLYNPLQRPRLILSSEQLADMTMRGYVEEEIPPDKLISRLSQTSIS